MAKLSFISLATFLSLVVSAAEPTWGRGFGGVQATVGGYNPGFGGRGVGGFNPGYGRPGVGGYNPGFGGLGVGGYNPGFGGLGVGGFNPGFGPVRPSTGRRYSTSSRKSMRAGGGSTGRYSGSEDDGDYGFDALTGSGSRKTRFPKKSTGGFRGGNNETTAAGKSSPPAARYPPPITFSGLPSDGGMNAVNRNPAGIDQRGLDRRSASDLAAYGDFVRRDFRVGEFYNEDWHRRYPNAWYPRGWERGTAWNAAKWNSLGNWFGDGDVQPIYYDYGNTVTYQDDSVYVHGQNVGTPDEYYLQAQQLASPGERATPNEASQEWLPLGVFAMTHQQQTKANLLLQLAVSKTGVIRGNYTATMTDDMQSVQGSVDKKTQRAAWTIGDNTDNVIETGIDNLTKDEASCLVHFGKDKTEQWTLVRLNRDDGDSAAATSADDNTGR